MRNFTIARWHPFSIGVDRVEHVDLFDEAFNLAGQMREEKGPGHVDDERVTISFNLSGRWIEWWWDAVEGRWVFDESM